MIFLRDKRLSTAFTLINFDKQACLLQLYYVFSNIDIICRTFELFLHITITIFNPFHRMNQNNIKELYLLKHSVSILATTILALFNEDVIVSANTVKR